MPENTSRNLSKKEYPDILFVFGTDTGVGKTRVCEILIKGLRALGVKALPVKPIETGHRKYDRESDASKLSTACKNLLRPEEISPFLFRNPLTPFLAAKKEGKKLYKEKILSLIKDMKKKCKLLIVEGTGGVLSPLSEDFDWLDIVKLSGGSSIIVIGNRLGAINHALLTEEVILSRKVPCIGWILNNFLEKRSKSQKTNLTVLKKFMSIPFIGEIPYKRDIPDENMCKRLSLDILSHISSKNKK